MAHNGAMLVLFLLIVSAYLLGSVSGSLTLGRLRGVDIRTQGSGNAGGTNAFRTQGAKFALGVVLIDIGKGEQFGSGFVEVNPNSKIPALLDRSGPKPRRVFESGSILLYLAEKFGAFLPADPDKRTETLRFAASDDAREHQMEDADEQVGGAEQHGVVSERTRDRQRDAEHRSHRGEHRQPHAALVDVHRPRQPGVHTPCPPQRREHEHSSEDSAPRRIPRNQGRDLGQREHEHEVEEELERRDLMLVAGPAFVVGVGHGSCRSGFVH